MATMYNCVLFTPLSVFFNIIKNLRETRQGLGGAKPPFALLKNAYGCGFIIDIIFNL